MVHAERMSFGDEFIAAFPELKRCGLGAFGTLRHGEMFTDSQIAHGWLMAWSGQSRAHE